MRATATITRGEDRSRAKRTPAADPINLLPASCPSCNQIDRYLAAQASLSHRNPLGQSVLSWHLPSRCVFGSMPSRLSMLGGVLNRYSGPVFRHIPIFLSRPFSQLNPISHEESEKHVLDKFPVRDAAATVP